ncbi:MAG: carboxyl transferase domain-containing protein [Solirubrobacterales bacterium]
MATPSRSAASVPVERLELLADPGTLELIRTGVVSRRIGERARPDDGVLAGSARVGGRPVFCYAEDPGFLGGSLGEAHADSIVRVMELADRAGAPLVGFVESGGARLQEGHAALAGYGRIFRRSVELSRRVPQISVVSGVSAGGGAYSPALTDFVVMTGEGRMFLTGPGVVRAALGEEVSMEDLGGVRVHGRNGVSHFSVPDPAGAAALVRELLGLLPSRIGEAPRIEPGRAPAADPAAPVPAEARKVYDVREVAASLLDDGRLLEASPRWAPNMITAMCRIEGRPIGLIANQPCRLAGVIDAAAAEKASIFIERCERFGLPLVVLVDTPGFMPGRRQEEAGVIRHGASLLRAFAAARVPKLTVVLRKAYGGAVITMNSRDLGADAVFAWPQAEIGIMAARQAVGIVHRRELGAARPEAHDLLAASYAEEHLSAEAAAASGYVDEVIEPAATRARLASALAWRDRP